MALTLKIVKIILSMLCALCALLTLASVISVVTLLLVIAVYVVVSFAAEKIAPSVEPAEGTRQRKKGSQPSVSHKYDTFFDIITGLIPMVFLVLLELTLQVAGFNQAYPLFMDSPGAPGYMQVNPEVVKRFLVQESPASAMQADTIFFLKDKPADGFRVFVLGESSAAGFPYGRYGSLAGMLDQRLKRTFPNKHIEVITTAMSAVSSYMLMDFTDEILAQKPDAILIYTGHNEYLGILGVGSAYAVSGSRETTLAFLKLNRLRLFQIVKGMYYNISAGSRANQPNRNVMAEIAREKEIPYGSQVYEAGVTQFHDNLDDMLGKYQQAGIPVLIGTLASNERDQAPFVSKVSPKTNGQLWEQYYQEGYTAIRNHDFEAAFTALAKDLSLDDTAADAYYAQGYVYEKVGKYEDARNMYLSAKDRDQLRFRAPEAFNDVIRQVAQQHNAIVVDVQAALRKEAVNGIISSDLILEHVHPNVRGYFLLTDAYYETLRQHKMIGAWDNAIPKELAWQEVPLTEVDLLYAHYKIEQLTSAYPFKQTAATPNIPQPTNLIEQLAYGRYYGKSQWLDETTQLLDYYHKKNDGPNSLKVALILADAVPFYPAYQSLAGQLLMANGQAAQALPYLKQAVVLVPNQPAALFDLAKCYSLSGNPALAKNTLAELLKIAPKFQPALDLLKTLE